MRDEINNVHVKNVYKNPLLENQAKSFSLIERAKKSFSLFTCKPMRATFFLLIHCVQVNVRVTKCYVTENMY